MDIFHDHQIGNLLLSSVKLDMDTELKTIEIPKMPSKFLSVQLIIITIIVIFIIEIIIHRIKYGAIVN